jgi:hypothetical protein
MESKKRRSKLNGVDKRSSLLILGSILAPDRASCQLVNIQLLITKVLARSLVKRVSDF